MVLCQVAGLRPSGDSAVISSGSIFLFSLLIAFLANASSASAYNARLAWSPVAGAAGYKVYIRQGTQTYAAGTDIRAIPPDVDGFIRYTTTGLPVNVTKYFAVTSYNAAGVESGLSNELSLLVLSATATPSGSPASTPTQTATVTPAATQPQIETPTAMAARTNTSGRTPTQTSTRTPTATPSATQAPTTTATAPQYRVTGRIRYYSTELPVSGVTVQLRGATEAAVQTDAMGRFTFTGIGAGPRQLEPKKVGDMGGKVSSSDVICVLQTTVGLRTLSEVEKLGCDITGDGTISILDAVLIQGLAAGVIPHFPVAQSCGSDWVFVPAPAAASNQLVNRPHTGLGNCRGGSIAFQPLVSSVEDQDFFAVLFGDCAGN